MITFRRSPRIIFKFKRDFNVSFKPNINNNEMKDLDKLSNDINLHLSNRSNESEIDTSNVIHPGLWDEEPRIETTSDAYKYGKLVKEGQTILPVDIENNLKERLDAVDDKHHIRQVSRSVYRMIEKGNKNEVRFVNYNSLDQALAYVMAIGPGVYAAVYNVMREIRRRNNSDIGGYLPTRLIEFGSGAGVSSWATMDAFNYNNRNSQSIHLEDEEVNDVEKSLTVDDNNNDKIINHPIKNYDCYDPSESMNEYHKSFWKSSPFSKCTRLSVSKKFIKSNYKKSDESENIIAMTTFTLSEINNSIDRRELITRLWKSEADIIVVIDRGTKLGFERVQEARNQLLGMEDDDCHVLSPCPHDGICPLLKTKDFCHFSQRIQRPSFQRYVKRAKLGTEDQKYSFVVIKRGKRPTLTDEKKKELTYSKLSPMELINMLKMKSRKQLEVIGENNHNESIGDNEYSLDLTPFVNSLNNSQQNVYNEIANSIVNGNNIIKADQRELLRLDSYNWPRIIYQPLKRKGHIILDSCHPNGRIARFTVVKSDGQTVYRDSRKSKWGDLFPHNVDKRIQYKDNGIKRTSNAIIENDIDKQRSSVNLENDNNKKVVVSNYDKSSYKRKLRGTNSARKLRKGKGKRDIDRLEYEQIDKIAYDASRDLYHYHYY